LKQKPHRQARIPGGYRLLDTLPLIQNDPFVLISNDPWDAQLVSQQC
jgi:hypothetical protein